MVLKKRMLAYLCHFNNNNQFAKSDTLISNDFMLTLKEIIQQTL